MLFFTAGGYIAEAQDVSDTIVTVSEIKFEGNKITRDRIIRRELIFSEGDTMLISELRDKVEQSRKNLMNTSLFNFVTYEIALTGGTRASALVTFRFIERWYVWPVPILEFADRNFNEWLKKKDLRRLNYGMFLTWNNFRGRRERVILYTRFGYDEQYLVSYEIPYINKSQTLGLGFSGGWAQNHEIAYNSEDNREVYFRSDQNYPQRIYFGYTELYYRKGIHRFHRAMAAFTHLHVMDSVLIKNPDYSFGPATDNRFITLLYHFRSDYRDFKQYPLNGYYFDVTFEQKGLGLFDPVPVHALSIETNLRKYLPLKGRFYWATGLTAKISPLWDQPYFYMQGLGYQRNFVRGYEYYVVDGRHFGLMKNNLKYELLKMREFTIPFIPSEKFNKLYYAFYLNLFADFGYVFDTRPDVVNPLANKILRGYGLGIDFVTYYDFVLRVEYSTNGRGESGFFIHFMPSI